MYKPRARNFTANFLSQYEKQEDALDRSQDDGHLVLTAEEGRTDLEPFLVNFWRKLSGILPRDDKLPAKKPQWCLKSFFIWVRQLFRKTPLGPKAGVLGWLRVEVLNMFHDDIGH